MQRSGGPGPDATWTDHWKPHDVGLFAISPYLTFDNGATNKRKNPKSIADGHKMGEPIWFTIGSKIEPGGLVEAPAGAPKHVEPEPPPPPAADLKSGTADSDELDKKSEYRPAVEAWPVINKSTSGSKLRNTA